MKRTKAKINAMKRPADLVAAQDKMRRKHEGRTMTAPAPFLPPTDSAVEQHFTPAQVAQQWGVSTRTVRRLFANTPGVLKLGTKGKHISLRIPARLLKAHYTKLSARLTRGQDHQVWRKIIQNYAKANTRLTFERIDSCIASRKLLAGTRF